MTDRPVATSSENNAVTHEISGAELSRRRWLLGLGGTATVGALWIINTARAGGATSVIPLEVFSG